MQQKIEENIKIQENTYEDIHLVLHPLETFNLLPRPEPKIRGI